MGKTPSQNQPTLLFGTTARTIARMMTKPMTCTDIALSVMKMIPTIERVQVLRVLNRMLARGLARRLNSQSPRHLYELTIAGKEAISKVSLLYDIPHFAEDNTDWPTWRLVYRSVTLTDILTQMKRHCREGPASAETIRRWISSKYPVSFPAFYRSIRRLNARGLMLYVGISLIGRHRMYILTESGKAMVDRLMNQKLGED